MKLKIIVWLFRCHATATVLSLIQNRRWPNTDSMTKSTDGPLTIWKTLFPDAIHNTEELRVEALELVFMFKNSAIVCLSVCNLWLFNNRKYKLA